MQNALTGLPGFRLLPSDVDAANHNACFYENPPH